MNNNKNKKSSPIINLSQKNAAPFGESFLPNNYNQTKKTSILFSKNNFNEKKNQINPLSWFGFSINIIWMMRSFQDNVLRENGILDIINNIFEQSFKDISNVILPELLLKFILYNQLNPLVPFEIHTLNIYVRTYFETFRDLLLNPILFLPDNVISRIIVTMTLSLCHENAYLVAMRENGIKISIDIHLTKIASSFIESFYVFGLNEYNRFYYSVPINLPNCGDVVSFMERDFLNSNSSNSSYIEAKLIELKKSKLQLLKHFLNPNLNMHVRVKSGEIAEEGNRKNNSRQNFLLRTKDMIINKTTGAFLLRGYKPSSYAHDTKFVLEFQNLSRTTEAPNATILSNNQIRLVVHTSIPTINTIFENVKRLLARFSDVREKKFENFLGFLTKSERNDSRITDPHIFNINI